MAFTVMEEVLRFGVECMLRRKRDLFSGVRCPASRGGDDGLQRDESFADLHACKVAMVAMSSGKAKNHFLALRERFEGVRQEVE